jgi:hypothetical protein
VRIDEAQCPGDKLAPGVQGEVDAVGDLGDFAQMLERGERFGG